jgi:hypothetical protein
MSYENLKLNCKVAPSDTAEFCLYDGNQLDVETTGDDGFTTVILSEADTAKLREFLSVAAPAVGTIVVGEGVEGIITHPYINGLEAGVLKMREAAQALGDAFWWDETAEGFAFWSAISSRLDAMAAGVEAHLQAEAAAKAERDLQGIEVRPSRTVDGKVTVLIPRRGPVAGRRLSPAQAREMARRLEAEAAAAEAGY